MAKIRVAQFTIQVLKRAEDILRAYISKPSWQDQLLPHDWVQSFSIETAYHTDVTIAKDKQTEERRALFGRPTRTLKVNWTSIPTEDLEKMLHLMRYMNEERFLVPIYSDINFNSEDYDNGGATPLVVAVETKNCRYFINGYVCVEKEGELAFRRLTGFTKDGIKIDSALPWSGDAGTLKICPCITAEQLLDSDMNLITDEVSQISITLKEAISKYALPPAWTGLPLGWNTFEDLPIIDPFYLHNWVGTLKIQDQRAGIQSASGRGIYTETWGDAPKRITSINLLQDREEGYKFLKLFDSRRGRLLPLWVIDAQGGWRVKAIGSGYIDVYSRGSTSYLNEVKYIGITKEDGSSEVREVGSVTVHDGDWRFNLTSSFTFSADEVIHCARARKSRFFKDALEQEYVTDNVIRTQASFIELLKEVNQ